MKARSETPHEPQVLQKQTNTFTMAVYKGDTDPKDHISSFAGEKGTH